MSTRILRFLKLKSKFEALRCTTSDNIRPSEATRDFVRFLMRKPRRELRSRFLLPEVAKKGAAWQHLGLLHLNVTTYSVYAWKKIWVCLKIGYIPNEIAI
jgi:hypothetical protein